MASVLRFLGTWTLIACCVGYNIDVHFPIVYSDPANYHGRSSYFGFSVILQANPHHPDYNWIQVGAPRGNVTGWKGFTEPGVVFRCPIAEPCWRIPLEQVKLKGTGGEGGITAWIGGAMDIQTSDAKSRSVVCGHRWSAIARDKKNIVSRWNTLGICFWMNQDFTVHTSPNEAVGVIWELDNTTRLTYTLGSRPAFDWGVAEMGSSVHLPPHTEGEILMGAPGMRNYDGNVVYCPGSPRISGEGHQRRKRVVLDEFTRCKHSSIEKSESSSVLAYNGYSVQSGKFFSTGERLQVAGGPRGEDFKGQVFLYDAARKKSAKTNVLEKGIGSSIGEYYGASLTVGDFNGDNLDDLVVGAPMFTKSHDEGCIYVYEGKNHLEGKLLQGQAPSMKISGRVAGGRFGTAVASLGDIDQDGYTDLAVGAPYEYDNRGAIYIFNGGSRGLNMEYSQKISAEDISPSLRGFGISIARPADIDNNLYLDIAVGSYISGHAVVLRGRPIVSLRHRLYTEESHLERNATKFTLFACSSYTGSNSPTQLAISRTLVLDEYFKRAKITAKGFTVLRQRYTKVVHLTGGAADHCEKILVNIQKNLANFTEPIEIKIHQELAKKDPEHGEIIWVNTTTTAQINDRFCKYCPIVSTRNALEGDTFFLKFDLECGPDNVCQSQLSMEGFFPDITDNTYTLGSNKNTLLLQINGSNEGELAYFPYLIIVIPSPVALFRSPSNCQINSTNDNVLKCELVDPLGEHEKFSQKLELDMSSVKWRAETLPFHISIHSQSLNLNEENSNNVLHLSVTSNASLTMVGKSVNSTYSLVGLHNNTGKTIYFYHVYEVQKLGVSPITGAEITVSVPYALPTENEDITFLRMYEPEGKVNDFDMECRSDYQGSYLVDESYLDTSQFSDDVGLEVEDDSVSKQETVDSLPSKRRRRDANPEKGVDDIAKQIGTQETVDSIPSKLRRDADFEMGVDDIARHLPANRTLLLNCSTSEQTCVTVTCRVDQFTSSDVVRLKIRMVIDIDVLEPHMGQKDIIFLTSQGSANIVDNLPGKQAAHGQAHTTFHGSIPDQVVNDWVIPLAIGIGLLLLFLVIMILMKIGFFQRKKRAELKALINAEADIANTTSPQMSQQKQEIDEEPAEVFEFE